MTRNIDSEPDGVVAKALFQHAPMTTARIARELTPVAKAHHLSLFDSDPAGLDESERPPAAVLSSDRLRVAAPSANDPVNR